MAALPLAHDRALVLYKDAREAVRSQYWMLGVMAPRRLCQHVGPVRCSVDAPP